MNNILYAAFLELSIFLYLRRQIFDFILPFNEKCALYAFIEDNYSKYLNIPHHTKVLHFILITRWHVHEVRCLSYILSQLSLDLL